MWERVSEMEDLYYSVKVNDKCKKIWNNGELGGTVRRHSLIVMTTGKGEHHIKGIENIFRKITEEKISPNLKKEMFLHAQKAHRTPNREDQERKSL